MGPAWLRIYDRSALRYDLIAGVMLAAYLLPAGIADASLAGLPPEAGLYACLFSGMVFWALCSSRHTAITVTSAISILIGTDGVLVARIDGSLLYFNSEHARDRLVDMLAERGDATQMILYLGAVPAVDLAGADMVIELAHALHGRGIDFKIAGAHTRVREKLALAGFDRTAVQAHRTVTEALAKSGASREN